MFRGKEDRAAEAPPVAEATPAAKAAPADGATPPTSLTFKCEEKDDKLKVTIVSCKGLPDLDGIFNLTDAFVTVRVGKEKKITTAVKGSLDPTFDPETSTFEFDVRSHYIRDLN